MRPTRPVQKFSPPSSPFQSFACFAHASTWRRAEVRPSAAESASVAFSCSSASGTAARRCAMFAWFSSPSVLIWSKTERTAWRGLASTFSEEVSSPAS